MRSLIKIAEKLDNVGFYKLADKLFKIAQVSNSMYGRPGIDRNEIFFEPGAEFLKPAPDISWADGLKKLDSLYSNNAYNFAKQLYEFGRINKINNLADAFDMYADAGALFDNQSIKINPIIQNLYTKVLNHNEMITEQQLAQELDQMLQQNNTYQGMPGLMKDPTNPSSYASYEDYLLDNNKKRAPIGTNNDDEIRDQNYFGNQQEYMNSWYEAINVYVNSNNRDQLLNLKKSIDSDVNLTPDSKRILKKYITEKS